MILKIDRIKNDLLDLYPFKLKRILFGKKYKLISQKNNFTHARTWRSLKSILSLKSEPYLRTIGRSTSYEKTRKSGNQTNL